MNLNPPMRRGLRAFTLIELILAVGISSIVLIAANAVFFTAMRLRESTTRALDESLPIQQAIEILRRDLAGAMTPSANGILSGDFKVGGVSSVGLAQPVDIELYTTTGVLRENEPWGEVQKVTYELQPPANNLTRGKDLIRSVTRNLLSTVTPQPENQWMMGGIESVAFSCFDGTNWYNTWDSTLTTNVPIAVRVRILPAAGGGSTGAPSPIEFLVPIDSVSRTNQSGGMDMSGN
ncbi:MAG TPA: type II secretion system protein GspJ [Candidatus Angelobacter sp.]|nr:type II secretion system protein GspJ [Candidatus Angelobacter sp.]